jgi:hypothetical protein
MGAGKSKVSNDAKQSVQQQSQQRPFKSSAMSGKEGMSMKDSHRFSLKIDASDSTVSIKTLTFRHVMKDPMGREYFMKFLKLEHAEENLIFFEVRK